MSRADKHSTRPRRRTVMAWSVLLASTLVLASLFEAVAGSALGGPVKTTPIPVRLSPATAALADGDDVRARFLASLRAQGLNDSAEELRSSTLLDAWAESSSH
jgi:hypothetical protein